MQLRRTLAEAKNTTVQLWALSDGRIFRLNGINKGLEACQRALDIYLLASSLSAI